MTPEQESRYRHFHDLGQSEIDEIWAELDQTRRERDVLAGLLFKLLNDTEVGVWLKLEHVNAIRAALAQPAPAGESGTT